MNWTPQQATALDRVSQWLRDPNAPQIFRLFGYAGTGKTTLARHLAAHEESGSVLFAAFTGKAASVLRDRGCENATTLHSLLYRVQPRSPAKVIATRDYMQQLGEQHPDFPEARAAFLEARREYRRPLFMLNPDSPVKYSKLLVLDEVSMVGKSLAQDLLSFGVKILVLGDPGQLPPIEGTGYFTQARPDAMLTEITRQAADSPIIRFATMARKGEPIQPCRSGEARKLSKKDVDDKWLATMAGQVLCGKNKVRFDLNRRIRHYLGHSGPYPKNGETLVCLRNKHDLGFLNGVICTAHGDAVEIDDRTLGMGIRYEGEVRNDLLVDSGPFTLEAVADNYGLPRHHVCQFDFGYAITVHKSQGSQWHHVTIWDDGFGKWDAPLRNQWLYTAITRASGQLTILGS